MGRRQGPRAHVCCWCCIHGWLQLQAGCGDRRLLGYCWHEHHATSCDGAPGLDGCAHHWLQVLQLRAFPTLWRIDGLMGHCTADCSHRHAGRGCGDARGCRHKWQLGLGHVRRLQAGWRAVTLLLLLGDEGSKRITLVLLACAAARP